MKRKSWRELSTTQKILAVVLVNVQVLLLLAALADLRRRDAADIRGGKRMWAILVFVNYIGPLAYFTIGRKRA